MSEILINTTGNADIDSDLRPRLDKEPGKKKKDKKGKEKGHKKDHNISDDHDEQQQPIIYKSYQNDSDVDISNELTAEQHIAKAKSKYDMKNHMANERTFFKYLFTFLHIGSIGTLVLTFFPNNSLGKLYLVVFIWLIAFVFMFWGLYGYYQRKWLMESGKFKESHDVSPHTPLLISGIFLFVILLVVVYGLLLTKTHQGNITLDGMFMMNGQQHVNSLRTYDHGT